MNFHETVFGRQFFEGTMPRIAKNLERIADALEKSAKPEIALPDREKIKAAEEELVTSGFVSDEKEAQCAIWKVGLVLFGIDLYPDEEVENG